MINCRHWDKPHKKRYLKCVLCGAVRTKPDNYKRLKVDGAFSFSIKVPLKIVHPKWCACDDCYEMPV